MDKNMDELETWVQRNMARIKKSNKFTEKNLIEIEVFLREEQMLLLKFLKKLNVDL